MSQRTTVMAVEAILTAGHDYDTIDKPPLQPYIDSAVPLVDFVVANASKYSRIPLTTAQAERVECWLAAHFYKCSDQQQANDNTDGASAQFTGQTGDGLKGTKYGIAACNMDTSRILLAITEGRIASTAWLGKVPSDQIPYYVRR